MPPSPNQGAHTQPLTSRQLSPSSLPTPPTGSAPSLLKHRTGASTKLYDSPHLGLWPVMCQPPARQPLKTTTVPFLKSWLCPPVPLCLHGTSVPAPPPTHTHTLHPSLPTLALHVPLYNGGRTEDLSCSGALQTWRSSPLPLAQAQPRSSQHPGPLRRRQQARLAAPALLRIPLSLPRSSMLLTHLSPQTSKRRPLGRPGPHSRRKDLAQGCTVFPCHFQVAPSGLGRREAGQSPPRRQGKFPG